MKKNKIFNRQKTNKSKTIPVLKYTAGITAAAGIAVNGLIIYNLIKNKSSYNDEVKNVINTMKKGTGKAMKKAEDIIHQVQYKNNILAENIKAGFYNVADDISKTVEDTADIII